eukprot:90282-Prymnesium_polylepis.1
MSGPIRATAELLCSHDHVVVRGVHSFFHTAWSRHEASNMAMAVTADETLDAVCHTRIQRHSAVWSA